jgi:hypothetical protein
VEYTWIYSNNYDLHVVLKVSWIVNCKLECTLKSYKIELKSYLGNSKINNVIELSMSLSPELRPVLYAYYEAVIISIKQRFSMDIAKS